MSTYSSFAELQGNTLQFEDHVIFEHEGFKIETRVKISSLYEINNNWDIENEIFKLLGLNAWDFCEQHYSKLSESWDYCKTHHPNYWPPHYSYDYVSITKVVLELFRLIEEVPRQLAETSEILFID